MTLRTVPMLLALIILALPLFAAEKNPELERMFEAIRKGDIKTVEKMLDSGFDVNATNADKMTPLHIAAIIGNLDIVKLLVNRGADVNAQDYVGYTPRKRAHDKQIKNFLYVTPDVKKKMIELIGKVAARAGEKPEQFMDMDHYIQAAVATAAVKDETFFPAELKETEPVEKSLFPEEKYADTTFSDALEVKHLISREKLPYLVIRYFVETDALKGVEMLRAIKLLGSAFGRPVEDLLRKKAASEDPRTRLVALRALARTAGRNAADLLLKYASDDQPAIRAEAVKWLGDFRVDGARDILEKALSDEDYKVRQTAASALFELGDKAAAPALIESLSDKSVLVTREALKTLDGLKIAVPAGKIGALLKKSDDPQTRLAAVCLLERSPRTPELAGVLVGALKDPDQEVRTEAAKTLRDLKPADLKDKIEKFARAEESNAVKTHLYPLAAELLGEDLFRFFENMLKDSQKEEDTQSQRIILRTMAAYYPRKAVKHLDAVLSDKDSFLHTYAAVFLKECHNKHAVDVLIKHFNIDEPRTQRIIYDVLLFHTGRAMEFVEQALVPEPDITPGFVRQWKTWWEENRSGIDVAGMPEFYRKEAEKRLDNGDDFLKSGKIEDALKAYKQAYFLDQSVGEPFERLKKRMDDLRN